MTVVKGTRLEFADASGDPATAGYLQRNGNDLKWHNGSGVITLGQGTVTAGSTTTFTNKTISGSGNTISNIANGSLTNSSITISDGSNTSAVALGGTLTVQGTANEVEVAESSGTVTVGLPNNVTIAGNLTVSGTQTILNTSTLQVEDKNIEIAKVSSPSDTTADGAGITIKGATDKTNKFYIETGALNKPTFPNIQGTIQELTTSSQEQRNELNKLILQNSASVGSVFSMPNAVLSETQIETTINSYYADNGTFKIPVNIQYAAKVAGINPIAAINAQIQASNEKYGTNRKLITASPAEEAIFDQVPSVQRLFTDFDNRSPARIDRGTAIITRTTGPRRASMTGTGVAPVEQTNALVEVAGELGVSPIDLATIIGFETGGTYDPGVVGGEGGNYQGLIQFGGPERAAYGVVPGMSFEEQLRGPVKRYFQDRFAQAGMSTQGANLEDLYTTVIAGNPGANRDARDSFGTSARSGVAKMGPHRERAMQRFGFSQN